MKTTMECIGCQHRIYCHIDGNPVENSDFDAVEKIGKRKRNDRTILVDSIIMRYRRSHAFIACKNECDEIGSNSEDGTEGILIVPTSKRNSVWSRLECFFFEIFGDSSFSKCLVDMHDSSAYETAPYSPMSSTDLLIYFQYLTLDKDTVVPNLSSQEVKGLGLSWASIEATVSAIKELHSVVRGQFVDPLTDYSVVSFLRDSSGDFHEERQAPIFNPVDTLPILYHSNQAMEKSDVQKLRDWTIILLSFSVIARVSDFCEWCPEFKDVILPVRISDWDADFYPKFIKISLMDGKQGSSNNKGKTTVCKVYRNYMHGEYCPVFHLLLCLAAVNIKSGPIFTKLRDDVPLVAHHQEVITYPDGSFRNLWVTSDGTTVNMTSREWHNDVTALCAAAAESTHKPELSKLTPHSFRNSAFVWAARCNAKPMQIMKSGRWSDSSAAFDACIRNAILACKRDYPSSRDDPVREFWVYRSSDDIDDV